MKRVALFALVIVFAASMAFAQAGSIGVFADPAGASCNLPGTGNPMVYVIHVHSTIPATASQFMIETPPCYIFLVESWTTGYLDIGDANTGVSLAYGGNCVPSPNLLGWVMYTAAGCIDPCLYVSVVAAPGEIGVKAVDCGDPANYFYPTGGQGIINSDPEDCDCDVPVEDTTWGGVKALYN